jgi:hypothetical protein
MGFQNWIYNIDDKLTRFAKWKRRYLVLFPSLFLLISILYYAFCFSPRSYSDVYANSGDMFKNFCGFGSLTQAILFLVLLFLVLAFSIVYLVILHKGKRLNGHKWGVFFVFLLSVFILCVNFALKANAQVGHTDWCPFDFYDSGNTAYRPGHWGVILDIFRHGTIEDFPKVNGSYWYDNQYYQNKLWHYLLAYFMRFNSLFIQVGDQWTADALTYNYAFTETEDVLMETTRIPVIFIGMATSIMSLRLIEKFHISGVREALVMGLFAFTPLFIMLPAYYNNDSLSFLFALIALYYTLDWHETFSWRSIILIALGIGLGMATKFNVGVMALPVAGVFLYELIRLYAKKEGGFAGVFKEHPYRRFWLQILVFVVIVFPLGLFFSVYQYKVYGIPLFYVWDNGTGTSIYINPEKYNAFIRFFIYPAPDMFFSLFLKPFRQGTVGNYYDVWGTQDFNIWTGFFQSTVFNAANMDDYPAYETWYLLTGAAILYSIFFLLSLYLLASLLVFVVNCFRGKFKGWFSFRFYFLLGIAVTEILSFIYFNWRYPHSCTYHARYILEFFFPLYLALAEALRRGYVYAKFLRLKRHEKKA